MVVNLHLGPKLETGPGVDARQSLPEKPVACFGLPPINHGLMQGIVANYFELLAFQVGNQRPPSCDSLRRRVSFALPVSFVERVTFVGAESTTRKKAHQRSMLYVL